MSCLTVLGVAKLHSNQLKNADNHNRRVGEHLHVDPERTHLNKRLIGENTPLAELVDKRQAATQARKQSNSVVAVEILLSASPEFFRPEKPELGGRWSHSKTKRWAHSAAEWLRQSFGENLLCVDVHLDENTPHIHAMVAPIVEKEFKIRRSPEQIARNEQAKTRKGTSFCAKDMFGRSQLTELHDSYASAMKPLGIERGKKGSASEHRKIQHYYRTVNRKPDENFEAVFPQIVVAVEQCVRSVKRGVLEKPVQFQQRLQELVLEAIRNETSVESQDQKLLEYWQQLHHWQQKYKDEKQRSKRFWDKFGAPEKLDARLVEDKKRFAGLQRQLQEAKESLMKQEKLMDAREASYAEQIKQLEGTNASLAEQLTALENQCYELEQELKPVSGPSLG